MEISPLVEHPQHIGTISEWYHNQWGNRSDDSALAKVKNNVSTKALNKNGIPIAFIAHFSGMLNGVVYLKFQENRNYGADSQWIGGLFVHPDFRRNGIGRKLMDFALNHADSLNDSSVFLQCESHLVDFYQSFGFAIRDTEKHSNIPVTIMERSQSHNTMQ